MNIEKPSKIRRFFPGSLSEGLITYNIWNLESGDHPYKDLLAKSIYKPDMNCKYFDYPFIFWLQCLKIKYKNPQIFYFFFSFSHFWQLKTSKNHFAF